MARSQNSKAPKGRTRYLAYAIPLIALAIVGGSYVLFLEPQPTAPAAMDFSFNILLQVSNKNSSQVRAIAPGHPIGEAGGYWATSQYNNDSVDSSHYPVYMDVPSVACTPVCVVHVKSRVVHAFTLGDFFAVWGQPLGENNTIGVTRSNSFAWQMCIGPPNSATLSNQWGNYIVQSGDDLTLFYYDTSTGLGCAPA